MQIYSYLGGSQQILKFGTYKLIARSRSSGIENLQKMLGPLDAKRPRKDRDVWEKSQVVLIDLTILFEQYTHYLSIFRLSLTGCIKCGKRTSLAGKPLNELGLVF